MGELAALLEVRLSTMTGVIDQLEGKGLVERADHPEDRRSLQVRLTSDGRQHYQSRTRRSSPTSLRWWKAGRGRARKTSSFLCRRHRDHSRLETDPRRKEPRHGNRIRSAEESDAPAIRDIYAPFVSDGATSFEADPPDVPTMTQRIRDIREKLPWLVFEAGGQVLGYAYASIHRPRKAYQWCVEVSVYVDGRARRKGVGRALYASLFDLLRRQGYRERLRGNHAAERGERRPP